MTRPDSYGLPHTPEPGPCYRHLHLLESELLEAFVIKTNRYKPYSIFRIEISHFHPAPRLQSFKLLVSLPYSIFQEYPQVIDVGRQVDESWPGVQIPQEQSLNCQLCLNYGHVTMDGGRVVPCYVCQPPFDLQS
jgi:hypothetical protein